MESDEIDSEEVDTTFDHTLNDASSFAHKSITCRRIRCLDHKYMFGQSTRFLTVRDVFIGWIYAYPVVDKSKPEVERVLRHLIGAKLSYEILFALTPERPQQSGHVQRSNALVSELAGIYLHQSGLSKKTFWKVAVRIAATALSLIPRAGRKSAFELTLDTPSWLAEIPFWGIGVGST
eukprot:6288797-Amphidinium_carterae.2